MEKRKYLARFLGHEINPEINSSPGDILGNTNNKIVDQEFPKHVSHFWGDTKEFCEAKTNAK